LLLNATILISNTISAYQAYDLSTLTFGPGGSGSRGPSGEFKFTQKPLEALGKSIVDWSKTFLKKENPEIVILRDTRKSGPRIKESLIKGIIQSGGKILDAGILPTPAAHRLLQANSELDIAIIITASHNSYEDNGIKLFKQSGAFTTEDENFIANMWQQHNLTGSVQSNAHNNEDYKSSIKPWPEAEAIYINSIVRQFPENFLNGKVIAIDCANGATHKVAPLIFRACGAFPIIYAGTPNGFDIRYRTGVIQMIHFNIIQDRLLACSGGFH